MKARFSASDFQDRSACVVIAVGEAIVIGKESVGKSQLIASLTGRAATIGNFRGTTVSCESYRFGDGVLIDTPGIVRQSDSATTRMALEAMAEGETVILVVQATHLDDDLADLLPLVGTKHGIVVVTFWDKIDPAAAALLERAEHEISVKFVPVDARRLSYDDRRRIESALVEPRRLPTHTTFRFGRRIEPKPGVFESKFGPWLAVASLILPALAAVEAANAFAGWVDPLIRTALEPLVTRLSTLPAEWKLVQAVLAGEYGLFTMGPLLFVWAVPTVVLYAFLLGAYKASGLVDRLNTALHPWVRPLGLAGRDVVRIVMGFGCNVPAVISTRSCSQCSRGTCMSAIAFGAACSYQLPATLAVFAAAGYPWLVLPYLGYVLLTTIVYLRFTSPQAARSSFNLLLIERRSYLHWPSLAALWREASGVLVHFLLRAMPIFLAITIIASLSGYFGLIERMASLAAPLMRLLCLPGEAALPIVMASIRKDGILLFLDGDGLRVPLSAVQVLTGVYLAGVLFPCLVTALTIARESSIPFALKLVGRQAVAALVFSALLGWAGFLLAD